MPNTKPLTTTQAALNDKLQRAASKCLVNYGFFTGATAENLSDLHESSRRDRAQTTQFCAKPYLMVSSSEICSDLAPHTLEEKAPPYPKSPSPNARSRDIFAVDVNSG